MFYTVKELTEKKRATEDVCKAASIINKGKQMSADNGVYILRTYTHYVKQNNSVTYVKEKFPVWRVAYASAIDNFDHYKKYQPENIGAYMYSVWKDSEVSLTEGEAFDSAQAIVNGLQASGQYLEYGIVKIETDYTFYQD